MIRLFGNHNSASRTRPGSAFVLYRGMTSIVPQMLQNRSRALAAEERLARAVGRGFIPGIKSALMSAALAAEVCFPLASPRNSSFSATCLAPKGERQ